MSVYHIKLRSVELAQGEMPVHQPEHDEECHFLSADGKTWKSHNASGSTPLPKELYPEQWEIAGNSESELGRILELSAISIAKLCEKSGTMIVFVRAVDKLQSIIPTANPVLYSLIGYAVFTTIDPDIETRCLKYLPKSTNTSDERAEEIEVEEAAEEIHRL
jgi:hypothetical protein